MVVVQLQGAKKRFNSSAGRVTRALSSSDKRDHVTGPRKPSAVPRTTISARSPPVSASRPTFPPASRSSRAPESAQPAGVYA